MPTGSGKTGVIAVIARCIPALKNILVITPRINLRDQLYKDIDSRFFDHLKKSPKKLPKKIINLEGSKKLGNIFENEDNLVIIMTFQKLESMKKNNIESYKRLHKKIDVLLIDEGHYEPAFSWSKTIREFKIPKIIFTATPFRNDLKIFDIDLKCSYVYDPNKFVEDIVQFYNSKYERDTDARVIIRCDNSDSIRKIARVLKNKRINCIAIHERFKNDPSSKRKVLDTPI